MSAVVIPPANPPRSHGWSGYPLLWLQVSFLRLVASAPAKNDKLPEDIDVVHSTIPSRDSGREIKVSIYRARGITPSGKILLNWHGSGAVMHFFGEDKTYCAWMAGQLKDDGVTVYDLDYRKAPENPFPAGIEDVEDGILHFASLPTTTHIAVGGFSAGAKFAVSAAVSTKPVLESRQSKAKVNAVIAFYPSIDVRPGANRKPPSSTKRSGVLFPLWVFGAFSRAFCVDPASAYDKRASPVLSEASEFPPHMLLICGDADAFHDDCKNFVDKLNATTPAHPDAKFLRTFPAAAIEPTGAVDLFRLLRPDEPLARSVGRSQLMARHDLEAARRELDELDVRAPSASAHLQSLLLRWQSALKATQAAENLRPAGNTTAAALRAGSWITALLPPPLPNLQRSPTSTRHSFRLDPHRPSP
ncbi:unnamed protein product [Tilletia controversa]|nr:unnamed protein product [Tilletia controversa]